MDGLIESTRDLQKDIETLAKLLIINNVEELLDMKRPFGYSDIFSSIVDILGLSLGEHQEKREYAKNVWNGVEHLLRNSIIEITFKEKNE